MLEVISGRFSIIATCGTGARSQSTYEQNSTYYESNTEVFTAEAAAIINQKAVATNNEEGVARTSSKVLSILTSIWVWTDRNLMNTEIQLALESVQISNAIYSGTVVMCFNFRPSSLGKDLLELFRTFNNMENLTSQAKDLNLKLGATLNCGKLLDRLLNRRDIQTLLQLDILKMSDFVVCQTLDVSNKFYSMGASKLFEMTLRNLTDFREAVKDTNSGMKIMVLAGYPSVGSTNEAVRNQSDFLVSMNEWGEQNNLTVLMEEAFDNPRKQWNPQVGHFGWWKLDNSLVDGTISVGGFIENNEILLEDFTGNTTEIFVNPK